MNFGYIIYDIEAFLCNGSFVGCEKFQNSIPWWLWVVVVLAPLGAVPVTTLVSL